jgi:hypothetical protein
MALSPGICFLLFACACAGQASAQDGLPTPTPDSRLPAGSAEDSKLGPAPLETIPLIVPKGMAVQIALNM